jgi:F-type H+-transporting ATPase subunit gamma
MAQTLEVLARRTNSIQGIRGVVHTMKSLSVINAAPYEQAAQAIDAYHSAVLEGLHAFFASSGPLNTGFSNGATQVVVVFGSDHGLCGSYNETLARHVSENIAAGADRRTIVLCIGAQMADSLADQGHKTQTTFLTPASVDGVRRLASLILQKLDDIRQTSQPRDLAVSLAYSARADGGMQAPRVAPLLPLDPALVANLQTKPWVSRSLPTFSMQSDAMFMALIREHLFASLFRAAAEAMVTENAARLALMQQAEHSVDEKLETLKSDTRALRQSEITTELLDVIVGFEALKKKRDSGGVGHHAQGKGTV